MSVEINKGLFDEVKRLKGINVKLVKDIIILRDTIKRLQEGDGLYAQGNQNRQYPGDCKR